MDFKIGDRVFLLPGWTAGCDNKFRETAKTGETGEIVFLNSRGQVGICFDRDVGGHDLSGGCKPFHNQTGFDNDPIRATLGKSRLELPLHHQICPVNGAFGGKAFIAKQPTFFANGLIQTRKR